MSSLSIQAKLKLLLLSISGAALLLACGVFLAFDLTLAREAMAEMLHVLAGVVGASSTGAIAFNDVKTADENLQTLRAIPNIRRAAIRSADGRTLAKYERVMTAPSSRPTAYRFSDDALSLKRAIVLDRQTVGDVEIESDLDALRTRFRRYVLIVGLTLLGSALFAVFLSARFVRVISRPILDLVEATRAVSAEGNYGVRVRKHSSDEIGLLVDHFNGMLAQLELRDRELQQHQESLEEKVAARTAELTKVNAELLTAKQKAEDAARAKSMFLANMSHEIRTPMNAILGMAELMRLVPLAPKEQQECLSRLTQASNALLTIINDILDFSKIEAGKLALEPEEFRLREGLHAAVDTLALAADEKGLELVTRVRPDVPDVLVGDASRLRQVLVNLLGNAVKFTSHGEVSLHVENTAGSTSGLELHFWVTDTGLGIPAERLEHIFRPFEQVDGGTTRRFGGTGLGLAIASQIVGLMGGKIWAESEPDRGSTFHFTACFELGRTEEAQPGPSPAELLEGIPIVVVDDSPANRAALEEVLTGWRMSVTTTGNAATALEALFARRQAGGPPPLVLVDARMPETDGFTLARRIREADLAEAVVLMLSPRGLLEDRRRLGDLEGTLFVSKPLRHSSLLVTLLEARGAAKGPSVAAESQETLGRCPTAYRVLVAEDNPINQQLVVWVLEKRGHRVTVVEDGKEAVRVASQDDFDVILMDLSMPTMDGLEATALLRKNEETTGRHVRVVAVTAHAIKGDREKCLALGMDGYLSKPIDVLELCAAVENVPVARLTAAPDQDEAGIEIVLDEQQLLPSFGRNPEILRKTLLVYLREIPALMEAVTVALRNADLPATVKTSHNLKSSLVLFGVPVISDGVTSLLGAARTGDLQQATRDWAKLERNLAALNRAVEGLLSEPGRR
ncbi:MAG: response regulator [Candidatus Riflebacteria bacterium]|nr:response regulator [Candidatus Riflebacteria bacterium]